MYKLILVSESNYFASAVDLPSVLLLHLSIQVYLDVRVLSVLWSVTHEPYMGPIGWHALDVHFSFYTFHSSLVLSLTVRTVEKYILLLSTDNWGLQVFLLSTLQVFSEDELERLLCGEQDNWDVCAFSCKYAENKITLCRTRLLLLEVNIPIASLKGASPHCYYT